MKHIAISIGHFPGSEGAGVDPFQEYPLLAPVAGFVIRYLHGHGHQAWMVPAGPLEEKVLWVNTKGFDLVVDIHANAGGGHGCETLHHPHSQRGKTFARIVQEHLPGMISEKDRGAKPGYYRGDPGRGVCYWLEKTKEPALILEPVFMDNEPGMNKLKHTPENLGRSIAHALAMCFTEPEE